MFHHSVETVPTGTCYLPDATLSEGRWPSDALGLSGVSLCSSVLLSCCLRVTFPAVGSGPVMLPSACSPAHVSSSGKAKRGPGCPPTSRTAHLLVLRHHNTSARCLRYLSLLCLALSETTTARSLTAAVFSVVVVVFPNGEKQTPF